MEGVVNIEVVENGKTALIAGASGLVGNELLQILLNANEYKKIIAIVRNSLGIENPKLFEVKCDFDHLDEIQDHFVVDEVFCCLGTTIKKAITKEAMYKIDVEYPLAIGNLAKVKGVEHFLLISSMNANSNSSLFYPRIKGILEDELKKMSFECLSIFRPSLLLGNRKEFRLGENIAAKIYHILNPFLKNSWKSRLAIEAKTVAQAMYEVTRKNNNGIKIYTATHMEEVVSKYRSYKGRA